MIACGSEGQQIIPRIPRIPNRDTRKPMKANLKPKPILEMPENRKLADANPIFLQLDLFTNCCSSVARTLGFSKSAAFSAPSGALVSPFLPAPRRPGLETCPYWTIRISWVPTDVSVRTSVLRKGTVSTGVPSAGVPNRRRACWGGSAFRCVGVVSRRRSSDELIPQTQHCLAL